MGPTEGIAAAIPGWVLRILERLWDAGAAAYVVGGSLRDILIGRTPLDWDLTTDALPDRVQAIFPDSTYENAFGTVAVRLPDGQTVQITTFRSDHDYADFRRPHRVEFGHEIEADLARRDFTVNAIAWGGPPSGEPSLVDPFGGRADIERRVLRAVGDPVARFGEDALRMLRAIRLAAVLDFAIEPADGDRRSAAIGRGDEVVGGPCRPPLGRTRLGGVRAAPRRRVPLGRAPARGRYGPARRARAGPRRPARCRPEQGPGRGPLGPHASIRGRCGRRWSTTTCTWTSQPGAAGPARTPTCVSPCRPTSSSPRPRQTAASSGPPSATCR